VVQVVRLRKNGVISKSCLATSISGFEVQAVGLVALSEAGQSEAERRNFWALMVEDEAKQPNPWKPFILPFIIATLVAILIDFVAPQLGAFAWASAWIGIMFVLSVWNVVTKR